jgi:hypothetical protein
LLLLWLYRYNIILQKIEGEKQQAFIQRQSTGNN